MKVLSSTVCDILFDSMPITKPTDFDYYVKLINPLVASMDDNQVDTTFVINKLSDIAQQVNNSKFNQYRLDVIDQINQLKG